MTSTAPQVTAPTTINLIVNSEGLTVHDFTEPKIDRNITDHISPEHQAQFQAALKTTKVLQNRPFLFFLGPFESLYLTSFTPSSFSGNVHLVAYIIPPEGSPDAQIDLRAAHTIKGIFLQHQALAVEGAGLTEEEALAFQIEAETSLRESVGRLSPFNTQKPLIGKTVPINLHSIIKHLNTACLLHCRARKKTFSPFEHQDRLPSMLQGDIVSLSTIMDNLFTNGAKYTSEQGSVEFRVEIHEDPISEEHLLVTFFVKDSGRGLRLEEKERIFARGDRLDAEESPIEGQGVGLFTAKETADQLGWILDYYPNEPGPGTTFFLRARFQKPEPVIVEAAGASAGPAPLPFYPIEQKIKPRNQVRVLFIEDNPLNQRIGMLFLKNAGIAAANILVATSVANAAELSSDPTLDCILSDHQLWSDELSNDILRGRRELESRAGLGRIPIILCSADGLITEETAHAFGTTALLPKPLNLPKLIGIMDQFFGDPKKT